MLGLDGSSWLSGWSWSGCCRGVCCSMRVGWSAMYFKLLPLFWVSEWVSLCMSPLRVKSQFPATLLLSGTKPCWVSKPDTMGADLTQCWFPGLECLMCGSNSLLLTEEPCICDFSLQLMSCCARDVGSDSTVSLPPLLQLFFLYILSCRNTFLLVFRLSSGRVSCVCCSFGVSMGRGELRIFLLCHLDPSSQGVKQVAQDHTVNKW